MTNLKYTYSTPPKHLTEEEYSSIISFVEKATDEEISEFLETIGVKFSGGNKGIDKEQVVIVVHADTNLPETKKKMLDFIERHR